jgi:hypothetical protein
MKPNKNIYDMNKEEIYDFIEKQLPIKTVEKNKYGEVFTSPILINKMLDLFPPRVWSASNMKWLDPSVGSGFFMIFVYLRLMEGLKSWQTNKHKRSQHIIQNMLYMVELNKTNCKICKSLFGSDINIFCGDFLDNIKFIGKETDVSFDCIIGNPPFQHYYGLTKDGKRISGGKSKLYEHIFLKSYSLLKNNGYLSFVVPDNIFAGNGSESYNTLIQNNIPFVSFNPLNQNYFGKIQQPVCYFILHKGETPGLTNVEHSDKLTFKLKLQNRPVNPIRDWTLHTEQLIHKYVSNERNNVSYNRGKSVSSYKGNKYPIIFTSSKTLQTNNIELASGLGIKKAIIFSISPDFNFKMDYSGKYGSGPNTFFIPFETNTQGKMLEKFLKSKDYITLALATKTSRQFLKIAFIEHLKLTKIMKTTKTRKHKKSKHKKKKKQQTLKNK